MSDKPKVEIIIIRETLIGSLLQDAGSFLFFTAMIGIGVLVDSSAMQWTGAVVAFLALIKISKGKLARLTIEQARARLDEIERAS